MAEVTWKFREVSSSKHTKCCLDKYNLIFPLLRFGALIILFKENICYAVNDLVLDWSKNWQVKSRVLMNFISWLNTKLSRDLFVTSWACTIGIWSTLTQLNLMRQIYALCYNLFWWLFPWFNEKRNWKSRCTKFKWKKISRHFSYLKYKEKSNQYWSKFSSVLMYRRSNCF